jgi:phenylacetate-CoA ligase
MRAYLKRLYPYIPVVFQNAAISAFGLVYKHERFGGEFRDVLADFEARDRWDVERMREYLDRELRRVVKRAIDAPYYRERWRLAGIRDRDLDDLTIDSLHLLPILPKAEVRRAPRAFVPDRGPQVRGILTYYSSGSTGTPLEALCTRSGQRRFAAAREARSYRWAGTSILHPRAMIGGQPVVPPDSSVPPFYRFNAAEKQVYFSAYHVQAEYAAGYVDALNRYKPDSITGYAFSQFQLARLMLSQKLRLNYTPRAAITSSEKLTERMRSVMREAWGCRAYEEYGSVENVALATECEAGSLHVSPDFGIVEIVDTEGKPVPPGVEGRLVCTSLLNDAQYLVRYEIGDTGAWSAEPCPCGRAHLPRLREITGRVEDVVVGPNGRELVRFHSVFIGLPYVWEGQIVQEAIDKLTVRVVADDGFSQSEAQAITQRLQERLGPVSVSVQRVPQLERTPRGKVRAVISHLSRDEPRGDSASSTPPAR